MKNTLKTIALGANAPSEGRKPRETLEIALKLIARKDIELIHVSRWWRTPAFPAGSGDEFTNAVAVVESRLSAPDVLKTLHDVEAELGRVRQERWGPRTCDLDLIACGDMIAPDEAELRRMISLGLKALDEAPPDQLVLPHPRMHERVFVLAPMAEVAPDWRHPVLGRTTTELLADLPAESFEGMVRL